MFYPISPVPLAVYPNGVQGELLVVNPNDSYITVSNSSAPMSGVGVSPRGNLTWPANTPLWVYGPVGAFVDVGGAPSSYQGDLSGQFAYALSTTTVKTDGGGSGTGDEDQVRVYSQQQIDALTAADKSTNFLIYNTDTSKLNYVVNGAVIVPTGSVKTQGQYQGNATTRTIALPFTPDLVIIGGASASSSTTQGLAWLHQPNGTLQSQEPQGGPAIGTNYINGSGFTLQNNSLNVNGQFYNYTAYKFS